MDFARRRGYGKRLFVKETEKSTRESTNEDTPRERYARILFDGVRKVGRGGGGRRESLMSQYV